MIWADTTTEQVYNLFAKHYIKKQLLLSIRDPLQTNRHIHTESEGLEKTFHANGDQKKAGVTILISDKIDFEIKALKRDKEGHYIMIKGSNQEDITITSIYRPNIEAPQYIRQILTDIKREMDSNTVIVGDFTPHLHQWTDYQNRKLKRKHKS